MTRSGRSHSEMLQRLRWVRRVLKRSPDPLKSPFGLRFMPMDGWTYREAWARYLDGAGPAGPGLTVYVHIPYCALKCSYCVLSSHRTPGRQRIEEYVDALREEIRLWKPVFEDTRVSTIHVGGGTPSILRAEQLDALLGDVRAAFRPDDSFQMGVEFHPSSTTREKLEVLRQHGVDRVSFGVQSFDPAVLRKVNRAFQSIGDVSAAVESARAVGIPAINLDLLAGLPGETVESFAHTVRTALRIGPDSLTVNRFLVESSPLAGFGYVPDREDTSQCDAILREADRLIWRLRPPVWPDQPLGAPAYGAQYVWDPSGKARNYFQQDMIGPASVFTIGHGALGHLHGSMFAISSGSAEDYIERLSGGEPAPMLTAPLSRRWEMAFYVADRASRGVLCNAGFAEVFGEDLVHVFQRELAFLRWSGLLEESGGQWFKPKNPEFQFMELFAFLLFSIGELRAMFESLQDSGGSTRRPYSGTAGGGKVVNIARMRIPAGDGKGLVTASDESTRQFALMDSKGVDEAELFDSFQAARASGMARIVLWTDQDRFASRRLARAAVEAGLTDLVLRLDPGVAAAGANEDLLAAVRRTIESFQGTILRRLVVSVPVKGRGGSAVNALVTGLAEAGAKDILLELDEGMTLDSSVLLQETARTRNLHIEVVHDHPKARILQYQLSEGEFPSSLFWCRIALEAVRAKDRSGAGHSRAGIRHRPETGRDPLLPISYEVTGGRGKSQIGLDHITQPKPRPVKR